MLRSAFFKKNMILFILLVILLILKFFTSGKSVSTKVDDYLYIRSSFFYSDGIPDSLPHRIYRNKEDSIRWKFYSENSGYNSGFSFLKLGAYERVTNNKKEYFFGLKGFTYSGHNTSYFRKDGQNFFIHNNNALPTALNLVEDPKASELTLLLSVSHTAHQLITAALYFVAFVILVYFLHHCFLLPLRILFKISKGQPFHEENISSLFRIGKFLTIFGILVFIINIVGHLMVRNMLPSIIHYSYFNAFMESWGLLVSGLIALIIARAFEKGAELQNEQDLTV